MCTRIFWGAVCILTIFMLSCAPREDQSNLVQPDKWWSVHPRPIYAQLEKVGTYQDWFDVYKLNENTFAIYEPNQFEEAICFLALGEERALLIDTGTGIGNLKAVVGELTDLPVSVVLTHEHYDHVAGAYHWSDITMYNNPDAIQVLKEGRDNASLQGYLKPDYLWKPLPPGFDAETWTIPSMEPTSLVTEGDIIDPGNRPLEVIYTPGHSPGQMCLLDKKNRLLFTGDHFFPGPLYAFGPDVNLTDYITSNEKLTMRIAEYDYLCSGHNDPLVKSDVIPRISEAFKSILAGHGKFDESEGMRRYYFTGFDVLIRSEQVTAKEPKA